MTRRIATTERLRRAELVEFLRTNRRAVLLTRRASGAPQMSPVTYGVDGEGRVVVSTYPDRAKAVNLRRDPAASLCVLGEDFDDAWVQVDGTAEVIDLPDSVEPLVEYYRRSPGSTPTGTSTAGPWSRRASRCCA